MSEEKDQMAKDKSTKEVPVAEEEAAEGEALPTDALTADETAQKREEYEASLHPEVEVDESVGPDEQPRPTTLPADKTSGWPAEGSTQK